eukprot:1817778-Pyramimonas_sp.AAC.1
MWRVLVGPRQGARGRPCKQARQVPRLAAAKEDAGEVARPTFCRPRPGARSERTAQTQPKGRHLCGKRAEVREA